MNGNNQNLDPPVAKPKFSISRWFRDRCFRSARKPPYFAAAYLDHLIAEYKKSADDAVSAQEIINKLKDSCSDITWGDLHALERLLAEAMSAEEIRGCLGILRFRLKQIASKEAFQAFDSSWPRESKDLEELRAELRTLIDLLHWYYFLLPILNRRRKYWVRFSISRLIMWTAIVGGISLFCALFHQHPPQHPPPPSVALFVWMFYLGVVGGYVSALRRLQALELDGDPLVSIYRIEASAYALWLSPLLGGTFAIILNLLFIGALLSGKFFPTFVSGSAEASSFSAFLAALHPKEYTDYALLLAWSFVAGFAERLVPDTLDKIIAQQKMKNQPSGGS